MSRSMTGFARREEQYPWGTLSCEIRSVNHRYLEPSFRMPEVLRRVEPIFREALRKKLARGKLEINIYLKTETAECTDIELNQAYCNEIVHLAEQVSTKISNPAQLNPLEVLRWPGVIQAAEIPPEVLAEAAETLFSEALEQLIENRGREGQELVKIIEQKLQGITENVALVKKALPEILEHNQQKLQTKLASIEVDVDPDRLAQELVIIAQKADVAEELDRLETHVAEVARTLKKKEPVGRRLDFLMQELNREANTLSSKSISTDTTQIAVDLKVLIEQMREQIQNIE
ncbi:YicC/YloC family endoribonuclease [Teredinibacter sp. KSP-S5-2]|uniref:YicC/YloC family endoribonuclease n=1 Tax=Teredinibacter sp. KSP-S5-2 TaxID=3034506 RepID=UPI00293485AD|nr:YicC/YloC family endoribonuclease [Teredinibacter sp. KSP-S5-2]WNO09305.1 YicC family protein [Teredinibacter sp. KSP-S5-2]